MVSTKWPAIAARCMTNCSIEGGDLLHELTIYRLFFTESDCYKAGVKQTPKGVQVHSTGANNPWLKRYVGPDDGRLGENPNGNTHNRPGGNVCASAYIGKLAHGTVAVYQTLPWDYRCWLSGSGPKGNANKLGYIGFEICEDNCENKQYFNEAVQGKAVLLTAYLCQQIGISPYSDKLEDHAGLHGLGLASNHGDIGLWLKKFGYTFVDFRGWVRDAMDEGVNVTYIDAEVKPMEHPTLRKGDFGEEVTYLQTLLCDVGEIITVDGKFGPATTKAVKAFQKANGLTVDGVVGAKTWDALEKSTSHDEKPDDTPPDIQISGLSFGEAITAAKNGKRIQRAGWNGDNQFVELATCISYKNPFGEIINANHDAIGNQAFAFVGTSGVQIGWLASQADMMAEDWRIFEK